MTRTSRLYPRATTRDAQAALTSAATQTGNFTAVAGTLYPVSLTSSNVTATLPAANVAGQVVRFKLLAASTNVFTIQRTGSDTINAAGTSLTPTLTDEVLELVSSGSGIWWVAAGQKSLSSLDARFGRYELARSASPAAGVLAALGRGLTTTIQIVGDSTGTFVGDQIAPYTPWPSLLATKLAAAYPTYNVKLRTWNATNQTYDLPTSVQAGPSGDSKITTSGSPILRSAGANVATDIDVRIKLAPTSWASGGLQVPVSKWASSGNQQSWWFGMTSTGLLCFTWTTDGAAGTQVQKFSSVTTGFSAGSTHWIRATLDVDNGSSGSTLKFYTSTDGSNFTQLGTTVTTAGVTSIFASTVSYQLCSLDAAGSVYLGDIYWVEIRDGLTNGVSLVPPLADTWDQFSASNAIALGGSPTVLIVNGCETGQNLAYWSDPTRKTHVLSPHAAHLVITNDGHNELYVTNDAWQTSLTAWQAIVAARTPNVPSLYITQNPQKSPQAQNAIDTHSRRGLITMSWGRSQAGVHVLDTFQAYTSTSTQVSTDGVHPNLVGAQAQADYMYRALFQAG